MPDCVLAVEQPVVLAGGRTRVPGWVAAVVVLALAGLMAVARGHTFSEPIEIDQSVYAVIAHEWRAGRALYADLWDHKPPAIFLTYAAGESLCGYGPGALYALGLGAAVLTLLGVYAAGSAHPWGRPAGLWASALWAVASGDLYLEASQPNTEDFINPCVIAAFALWVRGRERPWSAVRALLIGGLFAWASLYKHVVALVPLTLACVHVAFPPGGPSARWRAVRDACLIAAVGSGAWAVVVCSFAARGETRAFLDAVFRFNRAYAGNPARNLLAVLAPLHWSNPRAIIARLAFVGAVGVFLVGAKLGSKREWRLWAALIGGVMAAVAAPGRLFPHYLQLGLPASAVGLAWLAGSLREVISTRAAHGALVLLVGVIILARGDEYRLPSKEWLARKYAIYDPRWTVANTEARAVARDMDALLAPGETFYVWGHLTSPYFESRRHPPSGVLYDGPILDGPLKESLTARLIADLEAARPELVIDVTPLWADEARRSHPARQYWEARYRPLQGGPAGRAIRLYARRGGALEARRGPAGFPDS